MTKDQIMTLGKSLEDRDVFVQAYCATKNALMVLDKSLLYTIDIEGTGHYFVVTQYALHEFSDKRLHDPIEEGEGEGPARELMKQHGVDNVKFTTIIQIWNVVSAISDFFLGRVWVDYTYAN